MFKRKKKRKIDNRVLWKGKRIDNGKWAICRCLISYKGLMYLGQCGRYINTSVMLDSNTICQYTHTKDDNKNPIFENDILLLKDETSGYEWKAVAKIDRFDWQYHLVPIAKRDADKNIPLLGNTEICYIKMNHINAEIIGNTFDNPKLSAVVN